MENKTPAQIWMQWLAIPMTSILMSYFLWIWADDHRYFGFTAAWKIFFAFPITFFVFYSMSVIILKRELGETAFRVFNLGSLFLTILTLGYMSYLVIIEQTVTRWNEVYDLAGDSTGTADLHYKPILGKLGVFSLIFCFLSIILGIRKNRLFQVVIVLIFMLLLVGLLWFAHEFHPKRSIDGSI